MLGFVTQQKLWFEVSALGCTPRTVPLNDRLDRNTLTVKLSKLIWYFGFRLYDSLYVLEEHGTSSGQTIHTVAPVLNSLTTDSVLRCNRSCKKYSDPLAI